MSSNNDLKCENRSKSADISEKSYFDSSAEELVRFPEVRRRIRALMKLQFKKLEIDGQFEEEVRRLNELKYRKKYDELFSKRRDIITGSVEPTDEDCVSEIDSQQNESDIEVNHQRIDGIPGFWLDSLLRIPSIKEMITYEDVSPLIHLKDIVVNESSEPPKLVIEFHFEPNEYFENEVLTKEYLLKFGPNPDNTCDLDAFYPFARKGCAINWKDGKNLFEISESEEMLSFFSFFNPPEEPEDKSELTEDLESYLYDDWQTALAIAERLVPNAVLYYTSDPAVDEEIESSEEEE